MKILIAYFSHMGNTEELARKIQEITGGDLVEIVPKRPYPTDYRSIVSQAEREKREDFRPEIEETGVDVREYDAIFIGTPVWWFSAAPPTKTFLSQNDLSGKTVVPFCTHGGGGVADTFNEIARMVPRSEVKKGLETYENSATEEEIAEWISGLWQPSGESREAIQTQQ